MKMPRKRSLLTAAGCGAIAVFSFALFHLMVQKGMLQSLELKAYDLWLNAQSPDDSMSDNILVVEVRENDPLFKLKEDRLRDDELLKVLQKLQAMHPAAIAVDLFRDKELGPDGTAELRRLLGRDGLTGGVMQVLQGARFAQQFSKGCIGKERHLVPADHEHGIARTAQKLE